MTMKTPIMLMPKEAPLNKIIQSPMEVAIVVTVTKKILLKVKFESCSTLCFRRCTFKKFVGGQVFFANKSESQLKNIERLHK